MESLHYGEMLGEYYINSGFYWGSTTGIYCDILGRVCSRLSASRSHRKVTVCTPRRRGVPFTRVKGTKTRLGRCPKTPVAGCAGYGLICGGSRKSIRTAHRIAPKVATGVSALSPHPLSRWRERGPDGLVTINREQRSRGVRACKNRKPPTLKYLFIRPLVPLL